MFKSSFRERRRSAAVRSLGELDRPAELGVDRLIGTASAAFDAPMAFVTLVDGNALWIKSVADTGFREALRQDSFCQYAIDRSEILECVDPTADPRFAHLPFVTAAPYARYYIGAPLRWLSGIDVGALCVLDVDRRDPASPDQRAFLGGLARQVSLVLETRRDALNDRGRA